MSLFVEYGSPFPVWLFDYPFIGRRGPMKVEEKELTLTGVLIRELQYFQRYFGDFFDAVTGSWRSLSSERSHREQCARLFRDLDLQTRHLGVAVVARY